MNTPPETLVETFVETCDDDETAVRQQRDARRQQLEAQGLECRYEDCYRITDWRRVLLLIVEKPELASSPQKEQNKRVVTIDRSSAKSEPYRKVPLGIPSGKTQRASRQQRKVRGYETR